MKLSYWIQNHFYMHVSHMISTIVSCWCSTVQMNCCKILSLRRFESKSMAFLVYQFNSFKNHPFWNSYEAQLSQEKDVLLRIKGENGIMKKKLAEFHKDLEGQREEIGHLFQQKKELYEIIAIFERDMMCNFLVKTLVCCNSVIIKGKENNNFQLMTSISKPISWIGRLSNHISPCQ